MTFVSNFDPLMIRNKVDKKTPLTDNSGACVTGSVKLTTV